MEKRRLGSTGIEVYPWAFGGNVFGWTVDEKKSFELLDAFVAAGFNLIDTADVYSRWAPGNQGGESETIIGKWLRRSGKRDKVVIATKVGKEMGPGRTGLSKAYILRAVEDSLRRLQTDCIDLYQSHADDPDTPLEETFEAYGRLIKEGKIRAVGASNFTAERLEEALNVGGTGDTPTYVSLQPLYNLCDGREFESGLGPLCLRNGMGVITYFSLASGFLAGKYRSAEDLKDSARGEMVGKYLNDRGLRVLEALHRVARTLGSSPATVALAWLTHQPAVTAPIASATSIEQLGELSKAPGLKLDGDSLSALNQASAYT